jgi:protein-L-isoaspartate(D-aspartate) O-methyltransferase
VEKGFKENKFSTEGMGEVDERRQERNWLAEELAAKSIRDEMVLESIRTVPRHMFVSPELADYAYYDVPLSIGQGQTISQPFIVALMMEALLPRREDRVLEIGTGSGYAAAVLSHLVQSVYTIERHAELAKKASERFAALQYDNITVQVGDGTKGWLEESPFNGIIVAAAGPAIPTSLKEQLTVGGRLVIPIGEEGQQKLLRVHRLSREEFQEETICHVRFVPLIGEEGWAEKNLKVTKEKN